MKPKLWKVIYALPLIGCTLYAGGYVTQFIRNYQEWSQQGNFAGNGTNPQFPSAHPAACLEALRDFPYNLYGILICLLAFGILAFFLMRMGRSHFGDSFRRG